MIRRVRPSVYSPYAANVSKHVDIYILQHIIKNSLNTNMSNVRAIHFGLIYTTIGPYLHIVAVAIKIYNFLLDWIIDVHDRNGSKTFIYKHNYISVETADQFALNLYGQPIFTHHLLQY